MKGYSFYIDYRGSRNFGINKLYNIKYLYDAFRNFKISTAGHSVDYISFVGDAVLLVIKSNKLQNNLIEVIKEIEEVIQKVENNTSAVLGVGISYGKIVKLTDDKQPCIVSEATDWSAIASSLGNKTLKYRYVLPLKTKKIKSICDNASVREYIEQQDDIDSKQSASRKYFYFNL